MKIQTHKDQIRELEDELRTERDLRLSAEDQLDLVRISRDKFYRENVQLHDSCKMLQEQNKFLCDALMRALTLTKEEGGETDAASKASPAGQAPDHDPV